MVPTACRTPAAVTFGSIAHVLVIKDDQRIRSLLAPLAARAASTPSTPRANGITGLSLAIDAPPDVVVTSTSSSRTSTTAEVVAM